MRRPSLGQLSTRPRSRDGESRNQRRYGKRVTHLMEGWAFRVLILGTKEKASGSRAHTLYRGLVARRYSEAKRKRRVSAKPPREEKPMWSAARHAAFREDNQDQGLPFDDILPNSRGRFVHAGRVWRTDRQRSRTRFSGRAHAKTHDQQTAWENSNGTRLSWRARLFPMAIAPKPATRDQRFGKNIFKPVYNSDFS